jgi:hypothetical protein
VDRSAGIAGDAPVPALPWAALLAAALACLAPATAGAVELRGPAEVVDADLVQEELARPLRAAADG